MGLNWAYRPLCITWMTYFVFLENYWSYQLKFYNYLFPEGLYIQTGNDVISSFRSTANWVNDTTAAADSIFTKWRNFSITGESSLKRLTLSEGAIKVIYFMSCKVQDSFLLGFEKLAQFVTNIVEWRTLAWWHRILHNLTNRLAFLLNMTQQTGN